MFPSAFDSFSQSAAGDFIESVMHDRDSDSGVIPPFGYVFMSGVTRLFESAFPPGAMSDQFSTTASKTLVYEVDTSTWTKVDNSSRSVWANADGVAVVSGSPPKKFVQGVGFQDWDFGAPVSGGDPYVFGSALFVVETITPSGYAGTHASIFRHDGGTSWTDITPHAQLLADICLGDDSLDVVLYAVCGSSGSNIYAIWSDEFGNRYLYGYNGSAWIKVPTVTQAWSGGSDIVSSVDLPVAIACSGDECWFLCRTLEYGINYFNLTYSENRRYSIFVLLGRWNVGDPYAKPLQYEPSGTDEFPVNFWQLSWLVDPAIDEVFPCTVVDSRFYCCNPNFTNAKKYSMATAGAGLIELDSVDIFQLLGADTTTIDDVGGGIQSSAKGKQIQKVTITANDTSTTYRVNIINGIGTVMATVSVVGQVGGVNVTAAALQVALAASSNTNFTAFTWTVSGAVITAVGNNPGIFLQMTATKTGGTGTLSTSVFSLAPTDYQINIGTNSAATTYQVTIAAISVSVTGNVGGAAATLTDLLAAIVAASDPEYTNMDWSIVGSFINAVPNNSNYVNGNGSFSVGTSGGIGTMTGITRQTAAFGYGPPISLKPYQGKLVVSGIGLNSQYLNGSLNTGSYWQTAGSAPLSGGNSLYQYSPGAGWELFPYAYGITTSVDASLANVGGWFFGGEN